MTWNKFNGICLLWLLLIWIVYTNDCLQYIWYFLIPFGVLFGTSLGNMGFIGIGIPIGMAIGIAIGTSMDKKAFDEGKQLDIEFKN